MNGNPELIQIKKLLSEFYTPEETELWWGLPQERFDGKNASEMLLEGREAEVLNSLKQLDTAAYL